MKKSLHFVLPLVIYPLDIIVSIGEDDATLRNKIKKYALPDNTLKEMEQDVLNLAIGTHGRTLITSCNRSVLRLIDYPKTDEDYGLLAHEIFHVVVFILDRVGMKLIVSDSDEAYAYLIQYITTEIHKRIK